MKRIVERHLHIRGDHSRRELRKIVINKFLKEEPDHIGYHYHVETMKDGRKMFLRRPTRRFDFDFIVEVEDWDVQGTHREIIGELKRQKRRSGKNFRRLIRAIRNVHRGGDPTNLLRGIKDSTFSRGWTAELLLKVLKWYFILEDVYYWNYEGRNKLMKAIDSALGTAESES